MNCRQANRLLPLWIGRDLADASESEALRGHLAKCPNCADRRLKLQQSLETLQSISTGMLDAETHLARRPSLWPRLAMVLGEVPRRKDQFNGWIPAAAMALAASVMVGVSVFQFQRGMGDADPTMWNVPSGDQVWLPADEHFIPGSPDHQIPRQGNDRDLRLFRQSPTNW